MFTNEGYEGYPDSLQTIEKERLAIERRTIDYIATGELQPETDHALLSEKSKSCNNRDDFFWGGRNGGFFSYDLATNGETGLSLFVRYWGAQ